MLVSERTKIGVYDFLKSIPVLFGVAFFVASLQGDVDAQGKQILKHEELISKVTDERERFEREVIDRLARIESALKQNR